MARPFSASVPGPPHSGTASVLLQSSSLVTSGASCHFAAVRDSLISQLADIAGLGSASIISSWHAHTTSIGHSNCLQGSRVMLLVQLVLQISIVSWSKTDRDCDKSVLNITTFLDPCALCSLTQQCVLSPLTLAHWKNRHHSPRCKFVSHRGRSGTETLRPVKASLHELCTMFSPPLSSGQGSVHGLSFLSTYAWLLCLFILVRQSPVHVAYCVCVEVGSAHTSNCNQDRVCHPT